MVSEVPLNLTPLNNRVIVRKAEKPDKSKGGLLLPKNVKSDPTVEPPTGVIVAVGPGGYDTQTATRVPLGVHVGDLVYFFGGLAFQHEDKDYVVCTEDELISVITPRPAKPSPLKAVQ